MKLANIVSNTTDNVSDDFNVVKSLGEITQGLPTLIIGWDYVKKNYPKYNIIDRKLGDQLYWTFKKTEDRQLHDEDIYKFSTTVYKNMMKGTEYHFVDFISLSRKRVKKFLSLIKETDDIICCRNHEPKKNIDMVYMLINHRIYGVDLSQLEYMGLSKTKIVDKLRKNTHVCLEEKSIFIEYEKGLELLDNQVKFLPLLYSIKNG